MFGKIFGKKSVIDTMTKGVYNGVDKSILTNEERLDIHMSFLKLYEPFKLIQRLLVMIYCIPYMACWFGTFICSFFMDVSAQKVMLDGTVGEIATGIALFYFAGGALEGVVRGAMERGRSSGTQK